MRLSSGSRRPRGGSRGPWSWPRSRRVLEGLRAELLAGTARARGGRGAGRAKRSRPSNALRCGGSSMPPASCCTPIWDARRSAPLTIPGGYSNLEYDLAAGRRGKRDTHIAGLLERLLGAPGIAVNNNAAAIFLALNELAAGRRSDGLARRADRDRRRLPHPGHHGALGRACCARWAPPTAPTSTTTATAINERTRLLLRVHPSNFRIEGFTARPALGELAALGRERGIPVYEDLGSGCVVDLRAFGIDEPLVSDSLQAGADLVSFSGDKLLGGPQAGILAGKAGDRGAAAAQSDVPRAAAGQADLPGARDHPARPAAGALGRGSGAGA